MHVEAVRRSDRPEREEPPLQEAGEGVLAALRSQEKAIAPDWTC